MTVGVNAFYFRTTAILESSQCFMLSGARSRGSSCTTSWPGIGTYSGPTAYQVPGILYARTSSRNVWYCCCNVNVHTNGAGTATAYTTRSAAVRKILRPATKASALYSGHLRVRTVPGGDVQLPDEASPVQPVRDLEDILSIPELLRDPQQPDQ